VSVSTFIGDVLGKPAGAMSWWGHRIGLAGVVAAVADGESLGGLDAETLEELLKARGVSPNMKRDEAGDRGTNAHQIGEWLAAHENEGMPVEDPGMEPTFRLVAEAYAEDEERTAGTRYGFAVLKWWDERIQPYIADGSIRAVRAEVPIWYLRHGLHLGWAGQFDLALEWTSEGEHDGVVDGWEVIDWKTHQPAAGFTKPGKGAGYVSEAAQIRAYRMGLEDMGWGRTIGQRTVVLRDKAYRGECYLEDFREVDEAFVINLRDAYEHKALFEKGEE
jgi:hypothetical protein